MAAAPAVSDEGGSVVERDHRMPLTLTRPGAGQRTRGALIAFCLAALVAVPVRAADLHGRVVDTGGAGVDQAVVFVQTLPPGFAPPAEPRTAVMDQVNKTFVPHVLPIAVGTEVSFPNHDQIHHHVYSFSRAKTFEIPLYKGETAPPVRFERPGAVKVGCNIHDFMRGVILVVPTPYFAMTDANGAFTLRDLPLGRCTVVAWQENSKTGVDDTAQTVEVGAASPPLTFTLDLAPRRRHRAHGLRSYE